MFRNGMFAAATTVQLCLVTGTAPAFAQSAQPPQDTAAIAQRLFAASGLKPADARSIASQLPLTVKGGQLVDDVCFEPATHEVQVVDLNGDGVREVIVLAGNACANGMAGANLSVFTLTKGLWRLVLSVGAGGYEIMRTKHGGWADIGLALGGSCTPVWGMVDGAYDLVREVGQCK